MSHKIGSIAIWQWKKTAPSLVHKSELFMSLWESKKKKHKFINSNQGGEIYVHKSVKTLNDGDDDVLFAQDMNFITKIAENKHKKTHTHFSTNVKNKEKKVCVIVRQI